MAGEDPHSYVSAVLDDLESTASSLIDAAGALGKGGVGDAALDAATEGRVRLAELRAAVRASFGAVEAAGGTVASERREVDAHHLQLQNLLYEKNHLVDEIRQCEAFETTQMNKVQLVSKKEFTKRAGPKLTAVAEKEDAHRYHMNRLTFELNERRTLAQELKALERSNKALKEELLRKRKFIDSLPDQVRSIERSTMDLQQHMKVIPATAIAAQRKASELPGPLYMIYRQFSALQESGGDLELTIVDAVRSSGAGRSKGARKRGRADDDDEDDEYEGRGHSSKATRSDSADASWPGVTAWCQRHASGAIDGKGNVAPAPKTVSDLFKPAKDAVKIVLCSPDGDASSRPTLTVEFHYLPHLRIVTAEAEDMDVLVNLFPQDTGETTPRATNNFHPLAGKGLAFPEDSRGRPFRWAQWLAGLYSLADPTESGFDGAPLRVEPSTKKVLEALRTRLAVSIAIKPMLAALSKTPNPIRTHESASGLFKAGRGADFLKWEEVNLSSEERPFERDSMPQNSSATSSAKQSTPGAAPDHDDDEAVTVEAAGSESCAMAGGLDRSVTDLRPRAEVFSAQDSHPMPPASAWWLHRRRVFRAVFKAGGEHLQVLCEITPEYPIRAPRIRLDRINGVSHAIRGAVTDIRVKASALDADIRAVEVEVNGHVRELIPTPESEPHLLAHQLRRVQDLFDHVASGHALAEAGNSGGAGAPRRRRGRDRRPALVYDAVTNGFVHR